MHHPLATAALVVAAALTALTASPTPAAAQTAPAAGPDWTPTERAYVAGLTEIRVCADPSYQPFDFIDSDGRHRGIAADLLAEVGASLGARMVTVPSASWGETLDLARSRACDVVAMLNETAARAEYLAFTRPYVTFDNAIVTHRQSYHRGLGSLAGRTLALPDGYRLVELVEAEHPAIEVVRVENHEAALRAVSRGDAYATLVNHQRLVGDIQRLRLPNVHYAGDADLRDHYRVGVRNDDPMLLAVIDRALGHVPETRISEIMERWYVVAVEPAIPWRMLVGGAGVGLTIIAFLLLHLHHRGRFGRLLEHKNRELERLSATDALTGVANRRSLATRLDDEIERARRYHRPLSIILFDIDEFKEINDRHGHLAGDAVLVELAVLVARGQRQADLFGRWGGDEFLVVCSETGLEDARVLARRIRDEVAGHTFGPAGRVTLSIGTAELRAGEDRDALLHRADLGLYAVKADARAITARPQVRR